LARHRRKANRTEFPLPIEVIGIPNSSTRNQGGFVVKARLLSAAYRRISIGRKEHVIRIHCCSRSKGRRSAF
jgi:hypothetical protein